MVTLCAPVLAFALLAQQGPAVGNFEKAVVLGKVREAGFKASHMEALLEGAVAVRSASEDRDAQIARLALRDAELEAVANALAAGTRVTDRDRALLQSAVKDRELASTRWNRRVEEAVAKVIGAIPPQERYALDFPGKVRDRVDATLDQLKNLSGGEWDTLAQDVTWRLAQEQFVQSLKANAGSSDRGAAQDKQELGRAIEAQKREVLREGRAYLSGLSRSSPSAILEFKQRLAATYLGKSRVEGNLRSLVREILTAPGAVEALEDAVRKGGKGGL